MTRPKLLLFSLLLGITFLLAIGGIIAVLLTYSENDRLQGWNEYLAQPLPSEIVSDLCTHTLIPASLGDCRNADFQLQLHSIPDIFRGDIPSNADFDTVNQLYGQYLLGCEKDTLQVNSMRCQYKLASYIVAINYTVTSKVVTSMEFEEP